jgi:hypothetical protein
MGLAPIGTRASQIGFEIAKSALEGRLDEGVRVAILAGEQSRRRHRPEHHEHRIPAFSAEGSWKARLRQVARSIERYGHSASSWLDCAIRSDCDIPDWAIDTHAKLAGGAPGLGQAIGFRLHGPENQLSGPVDTSILGCGWHESSLADGACAAER